MKARVWVRAGVPALVLVAASCTNTPDARPPAPTPHSSTPASAAPSSPPAEAVHPVSIPALMQKEFDGHLLRVGRVLSRQSAYTRYYVTYESGGFTISGIMNVPSGRGPFPALVVNHGYHPPDVYTNGRGLMREQDYLGRRGYIVLHPDYRNHAQSDDDPTNDLKLRLGYTEDVINAALALRASQLSYVDDERIGILGRSMGGGVTLNAAIVRPDLWKAIVLFAPVSSDYVDNFERWTRGDSQRRDLADRIIKTYGSPDSDPGFWRNISPVNFFDRIRVPVLVHHGTADESVPIEWTHRTVDALRAARKDVRFHSYPGQPHAFTSQWPLSMQRTVAFLDPLMKS